jgi:hypothetical protein
MSRADTKFADPTERPNDARWHGDLIAVDPSVNSPGVSLFRFGKLVACTRVGIASSVADLPIGQRYMRVGMLIAAWWQETCDDVDGVTHNHVVRTVCYEHPKWLSEAAGKTKGNPNDLAGLVGVGQSFATFMACHNAHVGQRPPELLTPYPDEWTGQVPKTVKTPKGNKIPKNPWESPRGERIRSRLEASELAVAPAQHDAIDSIGLGLHALGRYERVRIFPGARTV